LYETTFLKKNTVWSKVLISPSFDHWDITTWYPKAIQFLMVGHQLDDVHQFFIQKMVVSLTKFPSIKFPKIAWL